MVPIYTETEVTVRQSDLVELQAQYRIREYPIIRRIQRITQGGGFGDHSKHPHAWSVLLLVDGQWASVISARGHIREWTSLDRLERWLRTQGFQSFWLENELDPTGDGVTSTGSLTPAPMK
mgnify:FL=1